MKEYPFHAVLSVWSRSQAKNIEVLDQLQGYLFSPPVTADAFFDMVKQDRRLEP